MIRNELKNDFHAFKKNLYRRLWDPVAAAPGY